MRPEHEKAMSLLKRLDANPEVKTIVVLDVLATFAAIFEADRRDDTPFVEEFATMLREES
jgi:hypothetical protein